MIRPLKEQLESLHEYDQLSPDHSWVAQQRSILLGQITATTQAKTQETASIFVRAKRAVHMTFSTLLPQKMVLAARPVMMLLLAAGLAVGGWAGAVSASYNSIPGDRLYQVKLATENVQKAVATIVSSDEESIKSDIDRAKRRAEEIREAVKRVQEDPSKKTKVNKAIKEVAVKELEETVRSAEEKLQQIAAQNESTAADVAQEVSEQTEVIKETLKDATIEKTPSVATEEKETGDERTAPADSEDTETIDALAGAVKKVSDIGINALATAVEKRGEEDEALLKEVLQKKVAQLAEDAQASVDAAEELLAASTDQVDTDTSSTTSADDADVTQEVSATSTITKENVAAISDKIADVDALVKEATALIEAGTLPEAAETVRTLYDTVSGMQEAVNSLRKRITTPPAEAESKAQDDPPESTQTTSTLSDPPIETNDEQATSTQSGEETDL